MVSGTARAGPGTQLGMMARFRRLKNWGEPRAASQRCACRIWQCRFARNLTIKATLRAGAADFNFRSLTLIPLLWLSRNAIRCRRMKVGVVMAVHAL